METLSYRTRRGEIETYFDRTAVEAWKRLTSDAPVSGIRATVRAGRDEMRRTLLDWLPRDLSGRRILDAGCGTGAFAVEAARRGADVVAIDLSPTLVGLAEDRAEGALHGRVTFRVGDMLDPALGRFDHVVAMDSLIHYAARDVLPVIETWSERTSTSIAFTFAPRTALLSVMHVIGRAFPRADRAPAIEPISPARLGGLVEASGRLAGWHAGRGHRVARGFYISQALELVPA